MEDFTCAWKFNILSPLEDPLEMWDAVKHETLPGTKKCTGVSEVKVKEWFCFVKRKLMNTEKRHSSELFGNQECY